ncbi:hypothetical protein FQA47_006507 [Oryzias melastigma]|uniref:Uncharacterized protein n=1 Tax=Oryzias melastigma TaxID=30732 RepID=A0A834FME8_ORYME|nr:hypothetical protein FQA47_006507 [Oryzias melastigma]
MEPVKFALLLLLAAFAQVVCTLGSPLSSEDDGDLWTEQNWQGYPIERGVTLRLADLIKRSKSQQFHGLMGRSSGARQPLRLGRKRNNNNNNKGEMFVGLMGRRSSGGGVPDEWDSDSY